MKRFLYALFISVGMFLAGCATKPEPVPKYITEVQNNYVVMEPPSKLYSGVARVKPPSPKQYINAEWEEKEKLLMDHIKRLNLQIDNLVTDRITINRWVKEQKDKVNLMQKEFK